MASTATAATTTSVSPSSQVRTGGAQSFRLRGAQSLRVRSEQRCDLGLSPQQCATPSTLGYQGVAERLMSRARGISNNLLLHPRGATVGPSLHTLVTGCDSASARFLRQGVARCSRDKKRRLAWQGHSHGEEVLLPSPRRTSARTTASGGTISHKTAPRLSRSDRHPSQRAC